MQPPPPAFARVENALSQSPRNSQLRADETFITPLPFPVSVQAGIFTFHHGKMPTWTSSWVFSDQINSRKAVAADNKAAAAVAEAWWHSR
jgi:hypothetical protein